MKIVFIVGTKKKQEKLGSAENESYVIDLGSNQS